MKYSYSAIALVLALAQAQYPDLPPCALPCFTEALGSDGCAATDFACHCSKTELLSRITPCVAAACTPGESEAAAKTISETCAGAATESVDADGESHDDGSHDDDKATDDAAEMTATETLPAGELAGETETEVVGGPVPTDVEIETEVVGGPVPTDVETETEVVGGPVPTDVETETEVVGGPVPTDVEIETEVVGGPVPTDVETETETELVDGAEITAGPTVDEDNEDDATETEVALTTLATETVSTDDVEATGAAGNETSPDLEEFEGAGSHFGAGSITTVAAAVFAAMYALS
ncbi:MAG: hypothetical protein M1815_003815 [Lichina confinis]|nr:MAG: hypothetical protein M1815_003815 [Lichina confinis]